MYYVTYEYTPYTLSLGGTTIPGLLLEDDQAVLDSQVRSHNAEENRPGSNNVVNKVRVALNLSLFFCSTCKCHDDTPNRGTKNKHDDN